MGFSVSLYTETLSTSETGGSFSVSESSVTYSVAEADPWILADGYWDDNGIWVDNEFWNDGT